MLQCAAVCCSVLQCAAVRCSALQCVTQTSPNSFSITATLSPWLLVRMWLSNVVFFFFWDSHLYSCTVFYIILLIFFFASKDAVEHRRLAQFLKSQLYGDLT